TPTGTYRQKRPKSTNFVRKSACRNSSRKSPSTTSSVNFPRLRFLPFCCTIPRLSGIAEGIEMSQESLYQDRLAKREKVRALGVDPYGKKYPGTQSIANIRLRYSLAETPTVKAAGRIMSLND